jgi:cell volume regulation protein A
MTLDTGNILLIGSILLFASVLVSKAGFRVGVPALVLFLGVGMLFGNEGLGIQFHNPSTAQFIGMLALSIILFSGGMGTKFSEIRPVLWPGVMLSTVGVVLTMLLAGSCIYGLGLLFGGMVRLSVVESMLLAAVMASTDSASVFSILRSKKKSLRNRLRPLLELESGSNDPMAYMLTVLLIEYITWGGVSVWDSLRMFTMQMCLGAVAGYLLGRIVVIIMNRIHLDNHSLYSVMLLASVFFIFSITDFMKGNGYLAVYIAGLVIGNAKMAYKRSMANFFDGFTWLFQIVVFLTLGLLVNPSGLLSVMGVGAIIAAVLIFFARPLAVLLCMLPFRKYSRRSRVYLSWVGLRGAVPIIFATYPMINGVEHADMFFNIVFCVTLFSLLLQGTTVGYFADLLGLSEDPVQRAFDIDLPEGIKSALSEIEVVPLLLEKGDRLRDLTMPESTLVVMIWRAEASKYFVPDADTVLHAGDKLLVISDNNDLLHSSYSEMGIMNPVGQP